MRLKVMYAIGRMFVSLFAILAIAAPAFAGSGDQPIEWMNYRSGSKRWSLSYANLQYRCKPNAGPLDLDYKFWIKADSSYDSDRLRIYSFDTRTINVFGGTSPIGRDLNTGQPYICLGLGYVANAGGVGAVAQNLFVWIQ